MPRIEGHDLAAVFACFRTIRSIPSRLNMPPRLLTNSGSLISGTFIKPLSKRLLDIVSKRCGALSPPLAPTKDVSLNTGFWNCVSNSQSDIHAASLLMKFYLSPLLLRTENLRRNVIGRHEVPHQGNRHSNLLYCGTVYTQMIRIVVGSDCVFIQYFARSNSMGR